LEPPGSVETGGSGGGGGTSGEPPPPIAVAALLSTTASAATILAMSAANAPVVPFVSIGNPQSLWNCASNVLQLPVEEVCTAAYRQRTHRTR
jgi:hypothetical protein